MRILLYSHTNELIGGIERYIETQLKVLEKCGYELSVVFEKEGAEKSLAVPTNVIKLTKDDLKKRKFDKVIIHKFDDLEFVEFLIDNFSCLGVVHDHDYYCKRGHKYFPNNVNCDKPFNPVVCELCSMFGLAKRPSFPYLSFKNNKTGEKLKLLKKMDQLVVISNYMKNNLLKNDVDPRRVFLVRPFVDSKEISSEHKNENGLYVGQLIKGKGILKFAKNLPNVSWQLDILGKGKDESSLKEIEKNKKISLLGFQNPDQFYSNYSFVVFTSVWSEPFGLVGIEAMSWGVPVVAFNVGGVSDWLIHGENGFLVEEGDYETFVYYCEKLSTNRDVATKMGKNAKDFVDKQYTRKLYTEDWKKVLEA